MAGDTVGCFYRPWASFQREFLIAGSPLLLYNSSPEVDAVLHGHKKPIASEASSFLPFSLWKQLPHTSTRQLAQAKKKKKMIDKEGKKNILEDEFKPSHCGTNVLTWGKERPEKADGGQKMQRLNQRNFLPGWKDLSEFFLRFGSFLETLPLFGDALL